MEQDFADDSEGDVLSLFTPLRQVAQQWNHDDRRRNASANTESIEMTQSFAREDRARFNGGGDVYKKFDGGCNDAKRVFFSRNTKVTVCCAKEEV